MARARNIKPGFFKNEDLVELAFEWRLLFIGLWTLCDREGRMEDRSKRIKMELFPADSIDIDEGLQALEEMGQIVRYEVDRRRYIWIPGFSKHQNPHYQEKKSEIPPYEPGMNPGQASDKTEASPRQAPDKPGGNPADSLIPDSLNLIPDSGYPESGDSDSSSDDDSDSQQLSSEEPPDDADTLFDEFWAQYPRREGKQAARKAFERLKPDRDLTDRLLADISRRLGAGAWVDNPEGKQFIPHASTYLNGRRWEDEVVPRSSGPPKTLDERNREFAQRYLESNR